MTDLKPWAYSVLSEKRLIGYVSLQMHYDALSKAYEYGDLDLSCLLIEAIQKKLYGPSIIEIKEKIK